RGRNAPTVLPVALEAQRVPDAILLLHEGRLPAVLEVVAAALAHERVANATEIDPQVRQLVGEQRPGVEQLAAVDCLPLIGGAVRVVTFRRKWVSRRRERGRGETEALVIPLLAV